MPSLYRWWRDNAVLIVAFMGYVIAAIIFAINLRDRLERIEQYGSPPVALLDKRLSLIEQQLQQTAQINIANSNKLDHLTQLMQDHLIGQTKK
jgi:hypothetical protein